MARFNQARYWAGLLRVYSRCREILGLGFGDRIPRQSRADGAASVLPPVIRGTSCLPIAHSLERRTQGNKRPRRGVLTFRETSFTDDGRIERVAWPRRSRCRRVNLIP